MDSCGASAPSTFVTDEAHVGPLGGHAMRPLAFVSEHSCLVWSTLGLDAATWAPVRPMQGHLVRLCLT